MLGGFFRSSIQSSYSFDMAKEASLEKLAGSGNAFGEKKVETTGATSGVRARREGDKERKRLEEERFWL